MVLFSISIAANMFQTRHPLFRMLTEGTGLSWDPLSLLEGLHLHAGKDNLDTGAPVDVVWVGAQSMLQHTVVTKAAAPDSNARQRESGAV